MCELARATGEEKYKSEALAMLKNIVFWLREDDSAIGGEKLPGQIPTNFMGPPMILSNVLDHMLIMDPGHSEQFSELFDWCTSQILAHVQRDGAWILEHVSPDGKELPGSDGRLTLPGHAIECGWFLLRIAERTGNSDLRNKAIKHFIETPFEYGWDEKYGGIFYFLDADGVSPTQLEWNMKLWWVHNEAMIAFLMAYKGTQDSKHLDKFAQVFDYSYKHFVDTVDGEWYGYLNQQGEVNMDYKGSPWKGCFHVPRCLWWCEKLLQEIIDQKSKPE